MGLALKGLLYWVGDYSYLERMTALIKQKAIDPFLKETYL